MNLLDAMGWVGTALNLLGAYQVTLRNRIGYMVFAVSCCLQLPGLIVGHVWPQVALVGAFIIIDVLGYVRWGTPEVVATPLVNCYVDCVD